MIWATLILSAISVTGPADFAQDAATSALDGRWRGTLVREGHVWDVWLHVERGEEGSSPTVRVSFPDWAMFLLETRDAEFAGEVLSFDTTWIRGRFEGRLAGDRLAGKWFVGEESVPARFTHVSGDAGLLRTEEVTVDSGDGARLSGTIVLPTGAPPYAGMVLTHGSGPDVRTTAPYAGKAYWAAMNGLAVLIYDKRGAGESTGEGAYRVERLVADAEAMVARLRAHPDVDPERVGVGGISQGAWVAPSVAAADPSIAFVFVVSAPGLSPAEQNVYSLETRLRAGGFREDEVRAAKRALRALYEYYRTGSEDQREHARSLIDSADARWASSEFFHRLTFAAEGGIPDEIVVGDWATMFVDPLAWWREVQVPVASFWGEDDGNLPAPYSRDAIAAALRDAGNDAVELHLYPHAGHGLTLEDLAPKAWPQAAPGYVAHMARWFAERAGRQPVPAD